VVDDDAGPSAGRAIHRLGDLIAENVEELAELDSLDNGKAKAVAAAADVPLAADLFWYMAGWATKLRGSTVTPSLPYLPGQEFHAYTVKEPVGVVAQIIPWNFPLLMAAWKVGPALATGCTDHPQSRPSRRRSVRCAWASWRSRLASRRAS